MRLPRAGLALTVSEGGAVIKLHRLNGKDIVINSELVESLECTPDTVVTMSNGNKFVVKEGVREIVELVIDFKNRCMNGQVLERVEKHETNKKD